LILRESEGRGAKQGINHGVSLHHAVLLPSWATRKTQEQQQQNSEDEYASLSKQVKDGPTPTAQQFEKRWQIGQTEWKELLPLGQVRQWPTPKRPTGGACTNERKPGAGGGRFHKLEDVVEFAGQPDQASPSMIGNGSDSSAPTSPTSQSPATPTIPGGQKGPGSLSSLWVMQLMGFPEEYSAELTRLFCEYAATHGSTKSRASSTSG